jgi:sugar phosphate isomerase/epimerase
MNATANGARRIRIGNQTAISSADPMEPFAFALGAGFGAFEWFEDRKQYPDGRTAGWDASDLDAATRIHLREIGRARDVLFTVHAPWQANPLHADGVPLLLRSIELARDLGADLVNLHLYMDEGAAAYVRSLEPVLRQAAAVGLRVSIENTPQTTPAHFNDTFALLAEVEGVPAGTVGMCLDIGHANLCPATPNQFVRFLDELGPWVPLIHAHVHENYGDTDSHLTLFTGPSRSDDSAVRAFVDRLRVRGYGGAMILEQWPTPRTLLVEAADRLRILLDSEFPASVTDTRLRTP